MIIFIYTHKNRKKHLQKHGDILKSQNDNKSEQTLGLDLCKIMNAFG